MIESSSTNRWWENYLVRYFLPALAGMLIILWLRNNSAAGYYIPKFIPDDWKEFGTAHLIFWLLLGSLYCYIASYPALVFHATRVLDFSDGFGRIAKWPWWLLNPYVWSVIFATCAAVCAFFKLQIWAIIAVAVFAFAQIARILFAMLIFGPFGLRETVNGKYGSSIAYAYLRVLSERRAALTREVKDPRYPHAVINRDEKDIVDSYRHLREHGNTALIVWLELSLCPVLYLALSNQDSTLNKIMFVSILALWILPSVLIHFLAQHLERRFSWFEYSPGNRGNEAAVVRSKTKRLS